MKPNLTLITALLLTLHAALRAAEPVPQPNEREYEAKKTAHDAEVMLSRDHPLPRRARSHLGS